MVHHENIFEREVNLLKDSLFVWTVLATLLGARLDVFFMTGNISAHLIEILLPIRENSGGNLFGFITGWEFTGYQGLAVMVLLFRL
jgi:hypothetical protein